MSTTLWIIVIIICLHFQFKLGSDSLLIVFLENNPSSFLSPVQTIVSIDVGKPQEFRGTVTKNEEMAGFVPEILPPEVVRMTAF